MLSNDDIYSFTRLPDGLVTSYDNILKITPLKIIDLSNPSFEVTYERKLGASFSAQAMGSILMANGILSSGQKHPVGSRFALEMKYYFLKTAPVGYYVSFELDYLEKKYERRWEFVDPEFNDYDSLYLENMYTDTFYVHQKKMGYSLKVGYQFVKTNRFTMDIYGGLGFAVREINHSNRNNSNDVPVYPRHGVFGLGDLSQGKLVIGTLPLNLRIGWTF